MLENNEKYNIAGRALNNEVKMLNEEANNRDDIFGVDFPIFSY